MNKSTTYRGETDPYRPQPVKPPHPATPAAHEAAPVAHEAAPVAHEAVAAPVVHEPGKLYEGDVPVHTEPPAHN